jgi:hypothetical protein
MTLIAAIAVTLAYKKQLAAPNRSSVKAKAYPSQPGAPQQAMRQAPSEETASGASVRGAPTRSVRGRERKREGGQERPGVRVEVGVAVVVAVWLEDGDDVWFAEGDGVIRAISQQMLGIAQRKGRSHGPSFMPTIPVPP